MPRGPRGEPAAIKRAKGNPGRRKIAEPAVLPADDLEAPPRWLDTSDVGTEASRRISELAVEVWRRLHADLVRLKLLKTTDENAFGRYCRYMAEWIEYTRAIDREGSHYTTSSEHVGELKRPHPAVRFRKDVEQSLKELGEAMGLTPAARQRIFQQLAAQQPPLPTGAQAPAPRSPTDGPGSDKEMPSLTDSPVGFLGSMH